MADTINHVILGSGDLYIADWTNGEAFPDNTTVEVASNKIGNISGGAEIEAKATITDVTDDFNVSVKEFITKETATFKTGILTWNMPILNKLVVNGEIVDDATAKTSTLFIGGRNTNGIKRYLIRFVHTFDTGLKLRVSLVGSANGEFKFSFDPDKATTIDTTFSAVSHDDDGTLIRVEMQTA
jgi:hypothetical protein